MVRISLLFLRKLFKLGLDSQSDNLNLGNCHDFGAVTSVLKLDVMFNLFGRVQTAKSKL
jgi:hypothetical protein